jgi:hypothetical protein
MMTMLGFLSWACAALVANTKPMSANTTTNARVVGRLPPLRIPVPHGYSTLARSRQRSLAEIPGREH